MQRNALGLALICCFLLVATALNAQDVYINGTLVTQDEIAAAQQEMGIPAGAPIPAGRYWYDDVSGLWGMEGGPTVGQLLPGLKLGGPLPADISGSGTNVFVNGREIHAQEYMFLAQIFGYVMPGRYWMDWQGIGGFEGGPPQLNVVAAAQAAGAQGGMYGGYTRRTPFGGLGGDGNCSYYLHPGGSSVMTC